MAMNLAGGGGAKSDINITPLVDVVLVMLIIFMVATPMTQLGYGVQVPKAATDRSTPPSTEQIVVRLDKDGRASLNQETSATLADFLGKLRRAVANRGSKIVFLAADGDLPYGQVAEFMDACRQNGIQNLGIVFDDLRPTAGLAQAITPPAASANP